MADFTFESLVLECYLPLISPLVDLAPALQPRFQDLARELYPHGPAWTRDPASVTYQVLAAVAAAAVDVELQIEKFRAETDPTRTSELLAEWERALGLPDGCLPVGADEEARRSAVVARLAGLQAVSEADLVAFLAALGFTVTFQYFTPMVAGMGAGLPDYGPEWQFVFAVHYWGGGNRALLECSLPHILPAHVVVLFFYGEFGVQPLFLDCESQVLLQII